MTFSEATRYKTKILSTANLVHKSLGILNLHRKRASVSGMGDVHVIIFVMCSDCGDYPITDTAKYLNSIDGAMSRGV